MFDKKMEISVVCFAYEINWLLFVRGAALVPIHTTLLLRNILKGHSARSNSHAKYPDHRSETAVSLPYNKKVWRPFSHGCFYPVLAAHKRRT